GRSQREEASAILRDGFARIDEDARSLRAEVGQRLSEARKGGDEAGKALRDEVMRQLQALGGILAHHLDRSAATQKERLDGVADEIRRLAQRNAEASRGAPENP